MPLLEIKEILRHWLRGRAKKLIARRLGVDVKTVRKYVRAAEEYGLTREVSTAPTGHVVFAVATKMCDQQPGRPRGEGWKWCSRHRERVRNLLEQRTTVSEIRSALGRLGVRVSASTLYRFVVSEFPHRTRAATDSSLERPARPTKVIAPPNQKRLTPLAERRDDEVQDGRMLRLLKRHEIQVLLRADHTQEEVAKLAGVAVSSVRRVAKEEPVEHGDDAAERAKRRIGRPSVVKKVRHFVQGTLRTRPDLDVAQILHQARLEGYRGGDSAFYGLVASLRSKGGEPVSRFEKPLTN
jgi:transposase